MRPKQEEEEAEAAQQIASVGVQLEGGETNHKSSHDDSNDNAKVTSEQVVIEAKAFKDINTAVTAQPHIPSISATAVLGESASMPKGSIPCRGHDFSKSSSSSTTTTDSTILDDILHSYITTGFQATNVGLAVQKIHELRNWRLSDIEYKDGIDDENLKDISIRKKIRARIFFAYTSNQISSGQREIIKFLVQHKMVDVIITTAGGIEEDIIKCFSSTYMGDFRLSGIELRKKGINRIGNLLIPNHNYCQFEDWISPIINKLHDEQDEHMIEWAKQVATMNNNDELPTKFAWTPSAIIRRLGLEINNPDSVLYWAAINNIPVFCPALTDGSIGDMLYFHMYKRPGFILDIAQDIRNINDLAVRSHCTGQIILGGGLVKHHTCNANLMRNGADYSIYINTASEYDGSDSGASPDEAISWGKIRINAKPIKITADATIVFPLLVASTFAKNVKQWKQDVQDTVCWVDDLKLE